MDFLDAPIPMEGATVTAQHAFWRLTRHNWDRPSSAVLRDMALAVLGKGRDKLWIMSRGREVVVTFDGGAWHLRHASRCEGKYNAWR